MPNLIQLNYDILDNIFSLIPSGSPLLPVLWTCRFLYDSGMPHLLRTVVLQSAEHLRSFASFAEDKPVYAANIYKLRLCDEWAYPHEDSDDSKDEMAKLAAAIIRNAPRLNMLSIEHAERACSGVYLSQALRQCAHLTELHLIERDAQLERNVGLHASMRKLSIPLRKISLSLCASSYHPFELLVSFTESLEEVSISGMDMVWSDPHAHVWAGVTSLTMSDCVVEVAQLEHAFPLLKNLGAYCSFAGVSAPMSSRLDLVHRLNLEHRCSQWKKLESMSTNMRGMYAVPLGGCRVDCLILLGSEAMFQLEVVDLPVVLRDIQPRILQLESGSADDMDLSILPVLGRTLPELHCLKHTIAPSCSDSSWPGVLDEVLSYLMILPSHLRGCYALKDLYITVKSESTTHLFNVYPPELKEEFIGALSHALPSLRTISLQWVDAGWIHTTRAVTRGRANR